MAYSSLIGDMGNTLSGGARQRVILARALYQRPKILFLDDATAHLDSDKEREISRVLQDLKITRISIAHRSELAAAAHVMLFRGTRMANVAARTEPGNRLRSQVEAFKSACSKLQRAGVTQNRLCRLRMTKINKLLFARFR